MRSISRNVLLTLLVTLALAGAASADLLDAEIDPLQPVIVFNNDGTTTFPSSAGPGFVTFDASAIVLAFPDGETAPFVPFGDLVVNIETRSSCDFIQGDLTLTGMVSLPEGPVSGILLTAMATGFGSQDSGGPTDFYDATFDVTGGLLADLFPSGKLAMDVTSEDSSFGGDCVEPFSGEAKGNLGAALQPADCCIDVVKTCFVEPPPPGDGVCEAKIAATRLRYTGPDRPGVDVEFEGGDGAALYENVDLVSGVTVLTDDTFSVDARPGDLSSKMTVFINGELQEVHHTSCSVDYVAGLPAPLDGGTGEGVEKGDPSPNWFVEGFVDKNGAQVSALSPDPADPSSKCTIVVDRDDAKKKKKKSSKSKKKAVPDDTAGNEVTYTYRIANCGETDVVNVRAKDDQIGPLTPYPLELPRGGDPIVIEVVETLTATTKNIVTVHGETPDGRGMCMDMDMATVTVEKPDQPSSKKKSKKSKTKGKKKSH